MPRRTPLFEAHRRLGARFTTFAGWEMPLSYRGAVDEHHAVRRACGLFDVSHMGVIEITGAGAAALCQELTVNDVRRLQIGDGQYTLLCNEQGGVLDDLILHRLAPERFLMVVNAANRDADAAWVRRHARPDVEIVDRSDDLALLALQGPESERALRTLTSLPLPSMRPFAVLEGTVAGVTVTVSRTLTSLPLPSMRPFAVLEGTVAGVTVTVSRAGYTGEDGFELLVAAADAPALWDAVLDAVRLRGGLPAGLAARDTLRLEAGLPLCGTDMDATTTPLETGLGWVVKLEKERFVGREALAAQARSGVSRRLVGLVLDEPGVPRHDYVVWADDRRVGRVTSGTKAPTLGTFIALAYVEPEVAAVGTPVAMEIRGRRVPAHVVKRPFYRRAQQEG